MLESSKLKLFFENLEIINLIPSYHPVNKVLKNARDGYITRDGDVIDSSDMRPYDTEVKSHSFNF